jgi:site-specific recombinase XerD
MQNMTLPQLVDQSIQYLKAHEYSQHTILCHSYVWNSLLRYAKEKGVQYYTLDFGMEFIVDHYGVNLDLKLSQFHVALLRYIRILDDIQQLGQTRKQYICFSPKIARHYFNIYELYEERLKEHGFSSGTIASKIRVLNNLLLFLEKSGVTNISRLKPAHIFAYLETLKSYAGSTRETILYALRDILRFLVSEGLTEQRLADLFPTISTHSEDPIPSVYSTDEIAKILNSIDTEGRVEKRDYAVLLLAARLGMRAGDIHKLRIDQIKWSNDSIEYVQQKTNTPIVLPLLKDVKLALLDYLKNSRPASDLPQVFLTTKAPYTNGVVDMYYNLLQKYLKLAHVEGKPVRKKGLHALRHSLASNLLAKNTPMPVITGILGHKQSDTTSLYLKIDLNQLRLLALEVPYAER